MKISPIILLVLIVTILVSCKITSEDKQALKDKRMKNLAERKKIRQNNYDTKAKLRLEKPYKRLIEGQSDIFIYDFVEKKYIGRKPPYELHEMNGVTIKIVNVNPLLYNVSLYELQGDQINNENLSEITISRNLSVNFKPISDFSFRHNQLNTNSKEIEEYKTKKLEYDIAIENLSEDTLTLKKAKDSALFDLQKKFNTANNENLRSLESFLNNQLSNIQTKINHLNQFSNTYNSLLVIFLTPNITSETIKIRMENMILDLLKIKPSEIHKNFYSNEVALKEEIRMAYNWIADLKFMDEELKKNNKSYSTRSIIYQDIEKNLNKLDIELDNNDSKASVPDQMLALYHLANNEDFTVHHSTQSLIENADFLRYKIDFNPKELPEPLVQFAGPYTHDFSIYIREGFKMDISSGFVLDLWLNDPSYYFDRTTSTTNGGDKAYVRENSNVGDVTPSLAVFLNGYKRTSTNFKPGGALGIGISNNARFRLYLGPSLIIGRKERIVFTGGVAFGAVSRLADGYEIGQAFEINESLPTNVPTVLDKFKFGGFFGIGLNLTGKANKNFAEQIKFK